MKHLWKGIAITGIWVGLGIIVSFINNEFSQLLVALVGIIAAYRSSDFIIMVND